MSDLTHEFGGDLCLAAHGDLALASESVLGQNRVLRRLLTNPGDYIWQLNYGAGLPSMIGLPVQVDRISGIVRSQIFQEGAVARSPAPTTSVTAAGSVVSLTVTYADAGDLSPQTLGISIAS